VERDDPSNPPEVAPSDSIGVTRSRSSRLTVPYAASGEPLLQVELNVERPEAEAEQRLRVIGVLDTGAERSLLPLVFAKTLGLSADELQEQPEGLGVGGVFRTWTATVPIRAQVIADIDGNGNVHWGPVIELRPAFYEGQTVLLGREDFGAPFTVIFDSGRRMFSLDHTLTTDGGD
jgi:hypothetical protein